MEPSKFFLDLMTAVVCYIAFVIGGVALVGGIAELVARWRERNHK
jgi:uncharacterized membrane protein HdeD (DUF308 family)